LRDLRSATNLTIASSRCRLILTTPLPVIRHSESYRPGAPLLLRPAQVA
jgi:hypothetical protein